MSDTDARHDAMSRRFGDHYSGSFRDAGAQPMGVEHRNSYFAALSYRKALAVLDFRPPDGGRTPTLLDVGAGYGGLLDHARRHGIALDYTGIDLSAEMMAHAQATLPDARFEAGDFLAWPDDRLFDYVICNGGLTQKLEYSIQDMEAYARRVIRRMFARCRVGIAFNMMPNTVNFMKPNLYYKSAVEMLAFLQSELSPDVVIDHAYTPFNYYCYVFQPLGWEQFERLRDAPEPPPAG